MEAEEKARIRTCLHNRLCHDRLLVNRKTLAVEAKRAEEERIAKEAADRKAQEDAALARKAELDRLASVRARSIPKRS